MRRLQTIGILVLLGLSFTGRTQVTFTSMTQADAFLCTGAAGNPELGGADLRSLNFGSAGTLVIAPATSVKGEFQSVLKFSLTNALGLFNTSFGEGHWIVTNLTLELTSNYGEEGVQPNNPIFNVIRGGRFVVEWLANDDWAEGTGNPSNPTTDGVTFASLPGLLLGAREALCTNTYIPPGNNVHLTWPLPLISNLVAEITAGREVTLRFYAADNQVIYLFNSRNFGRGNEPLIHITAIALPPLLRIVDGYFTNAVFHLSGLGEANAIYQIQANDGLTATNWLTLGTVTASGNGLIHYDDLTAGHPSRRFYRLARAPFDLSQQ